MTDGERQMPDATARLHAERLRRHALGLPTEIESFDFEVCVDRQVGPYLDFVFTFPDGHEFHVPCFDAQPQLLIALQAINPH